MIKRDNNLTAAWSFMMRMEIMIKLGIRVNPLEMYLRHKEKNL